MTTTLIRGLLPAAAAAVLFAGNVPAQEPEVEEMNFRPHKDWEIVLPNETWTRIGSRLPIPQGGESGFLVENTPYTLTVDTDANGRPDEDVKGVHGFTGLEGEYEDGREFDYAVRIRKEEERWEYASSGVMYGKVAGERITLIDQNNNNVWNEVGVDAMIVGKSDYASYLSSVVNLDGELYDLVVSPDGTTVEATPYEGEAGILNAVEKFETEGELLSAVFRSDDGELSFNLADLDDGLLVPAGEYLLNFGLAEERSETVRIRRGEMRPVEVRNGAIHQIAWGGPVEMRFESFRNSPEQVTVQPPTFWGSAGEEYHDFFPIGKSPTILVKDEDGRDVWSGKFCES